MLFIIIKHDVWKFEAGYSTRLEALYIVGVAIGERNQHLFTWPTGRKVLDNTSLHTFQLSVGDNDVSMPANFLDQFFSNIKICPITYVLS